MALETAMTAEELIEKLKGGELAYKGNIEEGSVLLGQSIGIINSIESVSDIINTMVNDAEKSIKNIYSAIN